MPRRYVTIGQNLEWLCERISLARKKTDRNYDSRFSLSKNGVYFHALFNYIQSLRGYISHTYQQFYLFFIFILKNFLFVPR